MMERLADQMLIQGLGIRLTPAARSLLASRGFDPALGARPLRRAIQRMVEDPLSEQILAGSWLPGQTVLVDVDGDEIVFSASDEPVQLPVPAAARAPRSTMVPRSPGPARGSGATGGSVAE
jgi:ATP-dependent Clp protease ATP-binding subunit ClpC